MSNERGKRGRERKWEKRSGTQNNMEERKGKKEGEEISGTHNTMEERKGRQREKRDVAHTTHYLLVHKKHKKPPETNQT